MVRRSLVVIALMVALGLGWFGLRASSDARAELTAEQRAGVESGVTAFMRRAAEDVTREGPIAWKKEFADRAEFFMASEGILAFRNNQEAAQGIEAFAKTIDHMSLHWGDDLRIDVLTPELAVVGTTWKEVRVDVQGKTVTQVGYFTGVAERRDGEWKFRDAHWSVPGVAAN